MDLSEFHFSSESVERLMLCEYRTPTQDCSSPELSMMSAQGSKHGDAVPESAAQNPAPIASYSQTPTFSFKTYTGEIL